MACNHVNCWHQVRSTSRRERCRRPTVCQQLPQSTRTHNLLALSRNWDLGVEGPKNATTGDVGLLKGKKKKRENEDEPKIVDDELVAASKG